VPAALALVLAGCTQFLPRVPPSEGHITAPQAKPEPDRAIPPPARVTPFVPPPKPAVKPQTYSVVVTEVPVKELLTALARDTKQNIDIHPGLTGLVSLNAINETLPAILERIAKQVNMRYRVEGNTIVVSPDTPYLKTYRLGYVNMVRDTTSTIGVTGEIASGAPGPAGAAGAAAATSGSSTVVRTVSKSDFWDQLRDNIRAILASTRALSQSAEERQARAEALKAAREERLQQAEAVARAGPAATQLFGAAFGGPPLPLPGEIRDEVVINAASGTVSVLATERQHQLVQQHLDSIAAAAQRQVLIEATIVEVTLSDAYQGGIDWGRVSQSGGLAFTQALIGNRLGAAPFFALFFNQGNARPGDLNFTLKLLQEFGSTRVLSSPKLMTLNNQTALLKVVDNIVYFEIQAQTSTTQGVAVQTFNTTPKTVAVGVVMGVTPQINDDGRVLLTVRPTVTRLRPEQPFADDPNPSLCDATRTVCIPNRVPQIQVREMESVLQVGSGQTVILGGLMQDDVRRSREQIPGADKLNAAGELLRFRDERVAKTELVIFLRPTVVANPSLESEELRFFQRFLPRPEAAPPPPEKTGAAR
jgi:general secretion pathway protein D